MSTTNERRRKRELQRLKEKLHKNFLERIKGKNEEEIKVIMQRIKDKYGLVDKQPDEHND